MKTRMQLVVPVALLAIATFFGTACDESGTATPPCDGSAAASNVTITFEGPCVLSMSTCPGGIGPVDQRFCDHTVSNMGAITVGLTGSARPADPVILTLHSGVDAGEMKNGSTTAICLDPVETTGIWAMTVTNPSTGSAICETSVTYDVTVTP